MTNYLQIMTIGVLSKSPWSLQTNKFKEFFNKGYLPMKE